MEYSLTRTVAAGTQEPVSLDDLKDHLRIDGDAEDVYLQGRIIAARHVLEECFATALVPTTCVVRIAGFPTSILGDIQLRVAHVTSITSIQYVDSDGVTQTWAASEYQSSLTRNPAIIRPAFTKSWPSTRAVLDAVTITFVAGYATPEAVPENVRAALMLLAAELYDKREPTVIGTIAAVPGFEGLMITENWGNYAQLST